MSALSQKAIHAVRWQFLDLTVGLQGTRGDSETVTAPDFDQIERVFKVAKDDFKTAGSAMQQLTNLFLLLVGVSVVIALTGLVLAAAFRAVVTGVTISSAGIIAMLALFERVHRYGRDQALFQFVISKYEMTIKLSPRSEYPALLAQFLQEVSILRDAALPQKSGGGEP